MSKRDELLRQAREARSLAAKAHRLAMGTNPADAARLIEYAQELDGRARALEAEAFGNDSSPRRLDGPMVSRAQEQTQQLQAEVARPRKEQNDGS